MLYGVDSVASQLKENKTKEGNKIKMFQKDKNK